MSTGRTHLAQAAAAFEVERGPEVRRGQDPAVGPYQADASGDRLGQPQVVAQVDPGVVDVEDAIGAGFVGQQAGDVPGERRVVRPARGHRVEWEGSPASSMARSPRPPRRRRAVERSAPLVEEVDPVPDALERLGDVCLEADQDADRVLVGAAADLVGVAVGVADDHAGSAPRPTGSGRARRSGRRPAPAPGRRSVRPRPGPSR